MCEHPSCFEGGFDPVRGVETKGDRKRIKRIINDPEGKPFREEWPAVDYNTKNAKGDCPEFEMKVERESQKRKRFRLRP